jgi:hypothetical protein
VDGRDEHHGIPEVGRHLGLSETDSTVTRAMRLLMFKDAGSFLVHDEAGGDVRERDACP